MTTEQRVPHSNDNFNPPPPESVRNSYANGTGALSTLALVTSAAVAIPIPEQPDKGKMPLDLLQFEPTDNGNAEAVWALHSNNFRYVEEWGWLAYTGTHWERQGAVQKLGHVVVSVMRQRRALAVQTDNEKMIAACKTSTGKVNACIQALEKHAFTITDRFDRARHLLNCPNGVVNLRTGELIPHSECDEFFTYCIPTRYNPTADSSTWADWVAQSVAGGAEVEQFLQQAVGYSATGETREECFFYLHGPTRSGKGTFTESLIATLGDVLAVEISFKTFAENHGNADAQNFALAPLKPARAVFASEPEPRDMLNPGKMKSLTGGNYVRCCFKGKDHFSYKPRFKIWLTSNPAPQSDPDDDAFWGRLRVMQFPHSHASEPDKHLKDKMQSDPVREGILRWVVEGARMWYKSARGLVAPDAVKQATQHSRDEMDTVKKWLDECTVADSEAFIASAAARDSYEQWCKENGYTPKGGRKFTGALRGKGYTEARTAAARGWNGFKLSGEW